MDYVINDFSPANEIGENRLMADNVSSEKVVVMFRGKNNVLFIEPGAKLSNVVIKFLGSNSVVFLRKTRYRCNFQVNIYNDSVFYMGKDNSINGARAIFQLSEHKHIIIGDDNMFSFGVSVRVADPHLIYSTDTMMRINPSRSVIIGDHVWIGQSSNILKGSRVGSGSIIAAGAIVTKDVHSNSTFGGSPARKLKENIFWMRPSVHGYTFEDTQASMEYQDDKFIYHPEGSLLMDNLEEELEDIAASSERVEYLSNINKNKNRFYL